MDAVIAHVNAIIDAHNRGGGGGGGGGGAAKRRPPQAPLVSLEDGSVCFGSAKQGWIGTLHHFADLYATKETAKEAAAEAAAAKAADEVVAVRRSASEVYESARGKALKAMRGGQRETRIAQLVLAPLAELHALAGELDVNALEARMHKVSGGRLRLSKAFKERAANERDPKALRREALRQLLPAAPALQQLALQHLPSPAASQRARATLLCPPPPESTSEGEMTASASAAEAEAEQRRRSAAAAAAVGACDPCGKLLLYVSKMVPLPGGKQHAAVARILSGTVRPGQDVYVLPPRCAARSSRPIKTKIARVLRIEAGAAPRSVGAAHAGTICALLGLEKSAPRGGTLSDDPALAPLAPMSFSVSVVERVAVFAPAGVARKKLTEAIPALTRGDPLVSCGFDKETAEIVLGGAGGLHIEACVHRLRELMGAEGAKLTLAPASVAYRESVGGCTPRTDARPGTLGKTANKHNRFWFVASPLEADLCDLIERGELPREEKERTRLLVDAYGWDKKHAQRILTFAPDGGGPNVLVDATVGVQGMDGVAELLVNVFEQLSAAGPSCGERLRGVRIDITDAKIHAESAQRRAPQVEPAAKRGIAAAIMAATPRLLEPMHAVQLHAPLGCFGEAYDELSLRRAEGLTHEQHDHPAAAPNAPTAARDAQCTLEGFLPLAEVAGLTDALRGRLHGKAGGLSLCFSHWRALEGGVWAAEAESCDAAAAVATIRVRKKLPAGGPPTAESLGDKL